MEIGKVREARNTLTLRAPLEIAIGEGDEVEISGERLRVVSVPDKARDKLELERGANANTPSGAVVKWPSRHLVGWGRPPDGSTVAHAMPLVTDGEPSDTAECGALRGAGVAQLPHVPWRGAHRPQSDDPEPAWFRRCPDCLQVVPIPAPWSDVDWPLYEIP